MKISHRIVCWLIVLLLPLAGCATVVDGTKQTLSFASQPPGASVHINGQWVGNTPLTVAWPRRWMTGMLTVSKAGYLSQHVDMSTRVNRHFWTNGFLGSSIDYVSGAMHEYEQDAYFIWLTPERHVGVSLFADKTIRLRHYLLVNHAALNHELATQPGDYVQSLMTLAQLPRSCRDKTVQALRQVMMDTDDPLTTSERATALLKSISSRLRYVSCNHAKANSS